MVKQIQRQYYVLAALYSCGANASSAMLMIYLLSRGLSVSEAMMAYACYFIALTLVEIPTGAGADVGGRKRAFVAACFLNAVGMMLYAFADNFATVALAASVTGVGAALAGGTLDSWLVAQVARQGQPVEKAFFWATAVKNAAAAISGFAGIYFAGETMGATWLIASAFFIAAGFFAHSQMRETDFDKKPHLSGREICLTLWRTARDAIAYWRANADVRFIVVAVGALYCVMVVPNMLWQPHFLQWLPDKSYLGHIWVGAQVASAFGALLAMNSGTGGRTAILVSHFVAAIGIVGAAIVGNLPAGLLWYFFYQVGRGAFEPLNKVFLHRSIRDDKVRTTVASIEAIGHHLGSAFGLMMGALVVHQFSREVALVAAGTGLLLFAVIALIRKKQP